MAGVVKDLGDGTTVSPLRRVVTLLRGNVPIGCRVTSSNGSTHICVSGTLIDRVTPLLPALTRLVKSSTLGKVKRLIGSVLGTFPRTVRGAAGFRIKLGLVGWFVGFGKGRSASELYVLFFYVFNIDLCPMFLLAPSTNTFSVPRGHSSKVGPVLGRNFDRGDYLLLLRGSGNGRNGHAGGCCSESPLFFRRGFTGRPSCCLLNC